MTTEMSDDDGEYDDNKQSERDQLKIENNNSNNIDSKEDNWDEFESFVVDGKVRARPEVIAKDQKFNCGAMIEKFTDFWLGCFQKCGLCKDDPNKSMHMEALPKRYIYWGPEYDQQIVNVNTIKLPHLEDCPDEDAIYGSPFVSNYISTKKYTILSFLPVNLFEQFRKKANAYFLIIACLSLTSLSPKLPIFSIAPLSIVLAVSAIKEAYEDYKRYEMDKEINNRLVDVCRPNEEGKHWVFKKLAWEDIQVGDVIRITKESKAFPADFVLLQSSTNQGLCNIETANLDGETNLKIKQAVGATYSLPTDKDGDEYPFNFKLQFKLESEAPNENIQKWVGAITFNGDKDPTPLGMNQFILRGCTLRNTDWIIGVVVFTGVESKIALNNKESKFKRSNVDMIVDTALYFIFGTQQLLCVFGIISHLIWLNKNATDEWYQYIDSSGNSTGGYGGEAALNYFTFLVLLDLFVPISLYVSMEMVKFTQAYLINTDQTMIEEIEDETGRGDPSYINASARTSNLNEELGQISFIFSDKTGTLTENKMAFLKCHIDGIRYGPGEMERQHAFKERIDTPKGLPPFDLKKCQFTDNRLAHLYSSSNIVNEFLTLMGICHSIIPEYPHGRDGAVVYNASSPDEKALVLLAKNLHYYFHDGHVQILELDGYNKDIDGHRFYLNIHGEKVKFDIYNMLEFTSKRKRMSVIVRDPRDNKMKLYSKGADNVIYQRLKPEYKRNDDKGQDKEIKEWDATLESLQHFAGDGLRTLVCGYKEIDPTFYIEWLEKLNDARTAMENREVLVEACYDEIETNLTLLGATAIEDKLQDGVPDAIANLAVAGISIWVLTGDKVETAINIGRSCRLLSAKMNREDGSLYVVDPNEAIPDKECEIIVRKAFTDAWEYLKDREDNDPTQGFVISGKALSQVFPARKHDHKGKEIPPSPEQLEKEAIFQEKILKILQKCRSVICCRVSPIQKAQMVGLVKQNVEGVITLAIGDGANDVPMIRAAHVGIGISGQEGLQAVMASDYAIAQFRFLQDLLLIHGAWDYRRISVLICYSFYKNIMFSMTQIWFAFQCGFSGTLFYDQLSGSCYNLVFTAMPVLLGAVFDRPYSKEIAKLCPELYENGPNNKSFNLRVFGIYCCEGVAHSIIVFFTAAYFIDSITVAGDGHVVGFWTTATVMFTSLVTVATTKMMLDTKTWTNWSILTFIISELLWFIFALAYSSFPAGTMSNINVFGVASVAMSLPQFWFVVILACVLCLAPEILYKYLTRMYSPTRLNVIQELEIYPIKRNEFIAQINAHKQKERQINDDQHEEDIGTSHQQTHLGFSEFQVGKDHPDFVMSQQKYMNLAMKKPRFSHLKQRIFKKKKSKSKGKTNTIQEEPPAYNNDEQPE